MRGNDINTDKDQTLETQSENGEYIGSQTDENPRHSEVATNVDSNEHASDNEMDIESTRIDADVDVISVTERSTRDNSDGIMSETNSAVSDRAKYVSSPDQCSETHVVDASDSIVTKKKRGRVPGTKLTPRVHSSDNISSVLPNARVANSAGRGGGRGRGRWGKRNSEPSLSDLQSNRYVTKHDPSEPPPLKVKKLAKSAVPQKKRIPCRERFQLDQV